MSFTLEITVPQDTATPVLRRLGNLLLQPARIARAGAEGALPVVQAKFRDLSGSNRNRFGVRSSFWNRMLSGTSVVQEGERAMIRMPREMALRYFGGTVVPKAGKYLTLPLRAEAYGKSVRQFDGVKFARIGGQLFAFTTDLDTAGERATGARQLRRYRQSYVGRRRITLLYVLKTRATIAGDKGVLPTNQELASGAGRGVIALVNAEKARA